MTDRVAEAPTTICIEAQSYILNGPCITTEQIRRLGSIRYEEHVYRESRDGTPDEQMPDEGTFEVAPGDRFYSLPLGLRG